MRFNASAFETFERPTNPRDRIPILTRDQVVSLIKVALSRPEDLGLPFTQWSSRKLTVFRRLRARYPTRRRSYVIMDNLNALRHPDLKTFRRTHRIAVVPTPLYARR